MPKPENLKKRDMSSPKITGNNAITICELTSLVRRTHSSQWFSSLAPHWPDQLHFMWELIQSATFGPSCRPTKSEALGGEAQKSVFTALKLIR